MRNTDQFFLAFLNKYSIRAPYHLLKFDDHRIQCNIQTLVLHAVYTCKSSKHQIPKFFLPVPRFSTVARLKIEQKQQKQQVLIEWLTNEKIPIGMFLQAPMMWKIELLLRCFSRWLTTIVFWVLEVHILAQMKDDNVVF